MVSIPSWICTFGRSAQRLSTLLALSDQDFVTTEIRMYYMRVTLDISTVRTVGLVANGNLFVSIYFRSGSNEFFRSTVLHKDIMRGKTEKCSAMRRSE